MHFRLSLYGMKVGQVSTPVQPQIVSYFRLDLKPTIKRNPIIECLLTHRAEVPAG
jgi:hypothetical protein